MSRLKIYISTKRITYPLEKSKQKSNSQTNRSIVCAPTMRVLTLHSKQPWKNDQDNLSQSTNNMHQHVAVSKICFKKRQYACVYRSDAQTYSLYKVQISEYTLLLLQQSELPGCTLDMVTSHKLCLCNQGS